MSTPGADDISIGKFELVQAGLSYDEVKRVVGMPTRRGAKISGRQFKERFAEAIKGGRR
jgi:hypothetical protein